jgi:prolyl oligopeptidase
MNQGRVWLFYARFPEPKQGTASQAGLSNYAVYFHALGTPQVQDRLVYATPDQPTDEVLPHDH